MPDLVFSPTMVAQVIGYEYGPEQTDAEGNAFRPILGVLPGVRIDVQQRCLDLHPALAAFAVEPAEPLHDCGPSGVRLYADSVDLLEAAAPPSDPPHPSDIFVAVADEMGL
ncbi:MAG: hypothetical protein H2041_01260 [Phenylobacterium sp.]|uniref:hypothetical protein n=1 Tax=Phenylobacterium sp. TaxID=1871053 RepID=UPI00180F8DC4|nr:hypothetical protein [Phenylobacterium sp.]MBA4792274.1 hypothetical protein [Phenylobacterium sp.]